MPFKTTPEQILELAEIMTAMRDAGVDQSFIVSASDLARTDQGVFDLLRLWLDAPPEERDELVADIQDSLDDYEFAPPSPTQKPYIPFDELDRVAGDITAFKAKLRQLIDRHGGVTAVSKKAGIPQPSLSRLLNSASIPRRATLYKIANALGLPETAIATEWHR